MQKEIVNVTNRPDAGLSLVEIMISAMILAIVGASTALLMGKSLNAASSAVGVSSIPSLRSTVSNGVHCINTLGLANPTDVTTCTIGDEMTLRTSTGNAFPAQIGNWEIKGVCRNNALGMRHISVEVKSVKNDPTLKQQIEHNWNTPGGDLFENAGSLCSGWLNANPCPAGTRRAGTTNSQIVCSNVFSCPAGQVLRGYDANGTPLCIPPPLNHLVDCPAWQATTGYHPNGTPKCTDRVAFSHRIIDLPKVTSPTSYLGGMGDPAGCSLAQFHNIEHGGGWCGTGQVLRHFVLNTRGNNHTTENIEFWCCPLHLSYPPP